VRVLLIACAAALTGSGVASAAAGSTGNGAIAFLRDGKVWVVEPDGSGERALAVTGDAGIPPQWSPTGALLAATRVDYGGGTSVPFVVRADGSPAGSGFVPYGSPVCWLGSARLLVLAQPSGMSPQADLYAVNADGSGLERLTSDGEAKNVTRQACAGDGSGVVYGETEPSTGVTLAYWVSAAGGAPRLLTPALGRGSRRHGTRRQGRVAHLTRGAGHR
jgi:Tol biopolymer transport system component